MSVAVQFTIKQKSRRARTWFSPFAIWLVLGLVGCQPQDEEPGYPLTGEILEVIPERNVLVVAHDEIPDYMPAMTMEFDVSDGDLANAEPGQQIRARLIEDDGDFRLERIWPNDRMSQGILDQTGRSLMEDTMVRGSRVFREVGEDVPEFGLIDQNGEVFQMDRLNDKKFVLNFIYTRCPVPDMCPAATQRMIQLQEAADDAGIDDFELISITLDPEYDTPGVLRQYAENLNIDTSNFTFLTGPESAVRNLMEQFGILIDPEAGVSSHTLGTMLADGDGVIQHRVFGSNWMVSDFLAQLESLENSENTEDDAES